MKLTIKKDEIIPLLKTKIEAIFPGAIETYDISISVSGYAGDIEFEFTEKPRFAGQALPPSGAMSNE